MVPSPVGLAKTSTMAISPSEPQPGPGISSAAKVGIAIAAAFAIVCLFSLGLWLWWRRRQKRQMVKDMVNFVDGDIVNLVDGGRFEKRSKPVGAYDPYYGSSSQSGTPSPVYYQAPVYYTTPPVDNYSEYYAPAAAPSVALGSSPSYPPTQDVGLSRDMPPPAPPEPVHAILPPPPSSVTTVDNTGNAWSNVGRHPWSPPDYDLHSPLSASSVQPDHDFHATSRRTQPLTNGDTKDAFPVVALPAILPDPKPEPQAELPAREGHHGWGYEQELDAPQQPLLRRQPPPQGNELEEQKFLLADVMPLRQQKSRPNIPGGPAG